MRKRSKACRAGLREADELVSINDVFCGELSHAEAMNLIDSGRGTLHLRIKRYKFVCDTMIKAHITLRTQLPNCTFMSL